ncbi:MAG TPA: hypothetical protein VF950_30075 [Planctomycetota bacterium]
MIALDPRRLFARLASDIPSPLRRHLLIVGSLAAAYHFRRQMKRRGVNTKDADVLIQPAGDVNSCARLAERLLALGWSPTEKCRPHPRPGPKDALRFIRLHPPDSRDYFLELLALPEEGQRTPLAILPVRLRDGWYGLCSHRYMRLADAGRLASAEGIDYAAPPMMALSNLLSHPTLGVQRMSDPVRGRVILRAAKDLGRVLALAWFEGREGVGAWVPAWRKALPRCFPRGWKTLAARAGDGLRALLADPAALAEAHLTAMVGLLRGQDVTLDAFRAAGERFLVDAVEPLSAVSRL